MHTHGRKAQINRYYNAENKGFSLIELLITVAIVGILASIAYPSYQKHVIKSRRADAQAVLMQNAQYMERLYTETNCYNPGPDDTCGTADDAAPTLPHTESPIDGSRKYYDLALASVSATAFELTATPKAAQSGDGIMDLDETGRRGWDENNDGDTADAGEADWEVD